MHLKSFLLLSIFIPNFSSADLPECPYIDPIKEMERWHNFDYKSCEVKHYLSTSPAEADRYDFGQKNYMFNVLVSDKLGPRRDVPNVAHEK
jgi:hypothetical protein